MSFVDSLKKTTESSTPTTLSLEETVVQSVSDVSLLASDDDEWILSTKYETTDNFEIGKRYEDENYSYVDEKKNVTVNALQINLTQEENSQYIPFEMFRYYDGIDLMNMSLKIFFVNKNGDYGEKKAINVRYNDTKIRFGFLVPLEATLIAGKLQFEIHATGASPLGGNYTLKTIPNSDIEILESLQGNGNIIIDETWATNVLEEVQAAAKTAQSASATAQEYVSQAQTLNTQTTEKVNSALSEIDTKIDEASTTIADEVKAEMADTYYTREETDTAISDAIKNANIDEKLTEYALKTEIPTNISVLKNDVGYLTEHQNLDDYAKRTELDGLASESFVKEEIGKVDVSDQLKEYAKSAEVYTKEEVDSALENVEIDLSSYATKEYVSGEIDVLNAKVDSFDSLVSDVTESDDGITVHFNDGSSKNVVTKDSSTCVEDVNKTESGISIIYTDGETKEIEISGGGGGSSSGAASISRITDSSTQCVYGDSCIIKYILNATDSSGDVVGNGTATWYVNSIKKATSIALNSASDNEITNSFDIGEYLSVGTNTVKVSVSVDTGGDVPMVVTKTWTVNAVNMYLTWDYDDTIINESSTVAIRWTPFGNLEKTTHIIIDGEEVETSTTTRSGVQQYVTISKLSHGSHLVELYLTATVGETEIRSASVFHDMIFSDGSGNPPVIGVSLGTHEMVQYNTLRIPVVIYTPDSLTSNAILAVDGEKVAEWTNIDRTIHYWNYSPNDFGTKNLTITSGETVKTITLTVSELSIDNEEVSGYAFKMKASDIVSNEALKSYTSNGIGITFSENFDWNNGGIQTEYDENGNIRQYICVKAGTTMTVNYALFGDDARVNGKSFKVIFKATNTRDYDAEFLKCFANGVGITLGANEGTIRSEQNTVSVQYAEDSYVEFEFDVRKASEYRYLQTYLDGVVSSTKVYASDDNFTQSDKQYITIGSDDCDVYIYLVKAYESSLTMDNHIDNFIADAPNAQEMVERYNRNDILLESGVTGSLNSISYTKLAEKNPDSRIHLWDIPRMTDGKKDYVEGCAYQQIYTNGDQRHQIYAQDVTMSIQGTSSVNYKESAANTDGNFTKGFTDGNGNHIDSYSMTDDSIGVNYFNTKVNVASCENINNMCLAEWYNRYQPYQTLWRQKNPLGRDCMELHMGVQFIKDQSHGLFEDDEYHMYAICNMGNSKKNLNVFHNADNPLECCIETKDNNSNYCLMIPNYSDGVEIPFDEEQLNSEDFFEFRYPSNPTSEMKTAFINFVKWMTESNPSLATNEKLPSPVTYGVYTFKGHGNGGTEVLAGTTIETYAGTYTNDTYEYRMAKMLNECEDHFVMDAMVYHYVFCEEHTMVDNVCKNTFWTTEDLVHWHLAKNYDNDTADGNDNNGKLIVPFGCEGMDMLTDARDVFNGKAAVWWGFIYGLYDARRTMWLNRENAGAWNVDAYLKHVKSYQDILPERVYNQDYWYKYLRLYEQNGTTTYLDMLEGGKKTHQRGAFVKNNMYYMASQYVGVACTGSSITMRGYTPSTWTGVEPKSEVSVMLYNKGYIIVQIGSAIKRIKAEKGKYYTITFTDSGDMNDTVINIHNANLVQAIGDISCLYVGRTDFAPAVKLRSIQIGSTEEGYSNPNLTEVSFGANQMLEYLGIQNCPNIVQSLDLTGCQALQELDIRGSGFTGVSFALGGLLEKAYLCSPVALNMRNLYNLEDANLTLESYENLTSLRLEDCPNINSLSLVKSAINLARVRILGLDWSLDDTSILDNIYSLYGFDENNFNTDYSVLAGSVFVPVMRQKRLEDFNKLWMDLVITYNTLVEQFPVTFVNEDGTILDVQYVDKGGNAVDPITREDNPIATPTKESTVSTDFTFAGWDTGFTNIFAARTITATYTESTRSYTITYKSKGIVKQTSTGLYGENIAYTGDTPIYTDEESAFRYYLFTGWDKSGIIDGDKVVEAVFDSCLYTDGYFTGKDLSELRPVEVYALTKLAKANKLTLSDYVEDKDSISISFGNDYNYDDVESVEIIADGDTMVFDGTNYYETDISLLDEDRDFVLAVDYKMSSETSLNCSLVQCYRSNAVGKTGFRLEYNSGTKVTWGTNSEKVDSGNSREMVVIRHKKGETGIHVYSSNLNADESSYVEISGTTAICPSTLVFGCTKQSDGSYENFAKGEVHWAKLWYGDLGDVACKSLVLWTHENKTLEMAGFKKFYLSDNPDERCSMTFIADSLMDRKRALSTASNNSGGWANTTLNSFMNSRMYEAIEPEWRQLIKKVSIASSVGEKSTEISYSDCYLTIPAIIELDKTKTTEPYISEGSSTSYLTTDESRIRCYEDGTAGEYWTRSPNVNYTTYFHTCGTDGEIGGGFKSLSTENGILIEFSI